MGIHIDNCKLVYNNDIIIYPGRFFSIFGISCKTYKTVNI